MPVVPEYKQSEQMGALPSFRVQPVANENTFGAGLAQAVGNAGDEAFREAVVQKHQDDTKAVFDASSAFTMDMMNASDELRSTKGSNANDIGNKFQQVYKEAFDKYSQTLTNKSQKVAFEQHNKPTMYNLLRDVQSHERSEKKAAVKESHDTAITTNNQVMAANYGSIDTVNSQIAKNEQTDDAYAILNGDPPEIAAKTKIANNTLGIGNAFKAAMDDENYSAADMLLKTYKDKVDPLAYANMHRDLRKVQDKIEVFTTRNNIIEQSLLPDGNVDREKAKDLLDSTYGENSPNGLNVKKYEATNTLLNAKIIDISHEVKQNARDYRMAVGGRVRSSATLTDAIDEINNSDLSDDEKATAIQQVSVKHTRIASGKASPEEKYWANYELKYMSKDLLLMQEYQDVTTDASTELKPTQQTKYNKAADNLNRYYKFMGLGGYKEPEPASQGMGDLQSVEGDAQDVQQTEGAQWYNDTYLEIKSAHPNATDEEIQQFMTKIITQNGG